jgi:hypothetical protein
LKFLVTLLMALLPMIGNAQTNGVANCQVNPGACQTAPTPSTCPSGFNWTLAVKGYAHCAKTNTEYRSRSCPSGTEGDWEQMRTVIVYVDGSTSPGAWTTTYKNCTAIPPPSCSNGATNYPACDDNIPKTCSNGATNYPACDNNSGGGGGGGTCVNGAIDYPTCTPPVVVAPDPGCTPTYTASSTSQACSGGQAGSIITHFQTNSCTKEMTQTGQDNSCSCPSGTTWDGTSCKQNEPPKCSNGATDYPTCTQLPAVQCPKPEPWCRFVNGQSGEYNYGTWEWGYTTYDGPNCAVVPDNAWGSCDQDMSGPNRGCTGCPAGF